MNIKLVTDDQFKIRAVKQSDACELLSIYSYYISESISTFETIIPSEKEMESRISSVLSSKLPWIVMYKQLAIPKIIGYAYAKQFHHRSAYSQSLEWSVYIDNLYLSQGAGKLAFREIKYQSIKLNKKGIVAVIGCLSDYQLNNIPYLKKSMLNKQSQKSLDFHKKYGFVKSGRLKNIGTKFGICLDTVYMQYFL